MKLDHVVVIKRPPEDVWRTLMDFERASAFIPYLREIRLLHDAEEIVEGSRVRVVLGADGDRVLTLDARVRELDPPNQMVVGGSHEALSVQADVTWLLEAVGKGGSSTRFRQTVELQFRSMIARIGARAMIGRAESELTEGLARFKRIAEEQPATGSAAGSASQTAAEPAAGSAP